MSVYRVALHSKAFPGKYLHIDGRGVTEFVGGGGGKVATQTYIGTWETFLLERHRDGTVSFRSTVFNDVFLRLDGANVKQGDKLSDGGGIVNCQFGSRTAERFKIVQKKPAKPDQLYAGVVGIESNEFPGRFLRVNGAKDQVNVQGVMASFEEWEILVVTS